MARRSITKAQKGCQTDVAYPRVRSYGSRRRRVSRDRREVEVEGHLAAGRRKHGECGGSAGIEIFIAEECDDLGALGGRFGPGGGAAGGAVGADLRRHDLSLALGQHGMAMHVSTGIMCEETDWDHGIR